MNEQNVRTLAVSYHSLLQAIDAGNFEAANTWAFILEKAQRDTGVFLIRQDLAEFWIKWKGAA